MANKTFKILTDKMGGRAATSYIGTEGDVFFDPTSTTLRISDGVTPGGATMSGSGGGTGDLTIANTTITALQEEDIVLVTSRNAMTSPPSIDTNVLTLQANGTLVLPGAIKVPQEEDLVLTTSHYAMGSPPGVQTHNVTLQANGVLKVPGTITTSSQYGDLILRGRDNGTISIENGVAGTIEIGYQADSGDVYIGAGGYGTLVSIEADRFRFVSNAPTSSKGQVGDVPGQVAFSSSHAYYCTMGYTDGTADIWKRVALTGGAW